VAFVGLAEDAVTWATQATTNAPSSLSSAQLERIYNCTFTNWAQVGGRPAPIHPLLPQPGSGIREFFLTAIHLANPGTGPGPCVSDGRGFLQENEGVNLLLQDPDAIIPYSVAKFLTEEFRSNKCITRPSCAPTVNGVVCKHTSGKNLFGCDTHGTMVLKKVNGLSPTVGAGPATKINPRFSPDFLTTASEVVPWDPNTADHMPGPEAGAPGGLNLEPLFGVNGWVCHSPTAKQDLISYGFLTIRTCGHTN
jgi:hypothetical protein